MTDHRPTPSAEELPTFSMSNPMGRDYAMSAESSAAIDLDIVIPYNKAYDSMEVTFGTFNESIGETTLKIIDVQTAHVGRYLLYRSDEPEYSGLNETEVNDEPVHNSYYFHMTQVTSLKTVNTPSHEYEDSTLRLRVFVVCRGNTSHLLTDGDSLWISATVSLGDDYIYAGRMAIEYSVSPVDFYTGYVWQPTIDMTLAEGYTTNMVGRGTILRYNIAVNLPYRTSDSIDVYIHPSAAPIQVCRVEQRGIGSAIVDYLPPGTSDAKIYYDETQRLTHSDSSVPAVTSYSYDYYTPYAADAYINFTAIVMLEEYSDTNATYEFTTNVRLGHIPLVQFTPDIIATDYMPSVEVKPMFNITHHMGTDAINVGGSEIIYFDMYIPPATSHRYNVHVHAPWNDTYHGEYKILHAFMVSSGSDLACFNGYTTNVTILKSNGTDDTAVFATSFVANIADDSEGFIPSESNKVGMAVHVALKANTSIPIGDKIPVAVVVDINNYDDIWLGHLDLEVIPPEDDRNMVMADNLTLAVTSYSDRIFSIGERQFFHALVSVPRGFAVTQFQIVIESPMVGDETLLTVAQPNLTYHGSNVMETEDYVHSSNDTDFLQTYTQTIDFGFVRNLGISDVSDFIEEVDGEDVFEFEFSVRLMDHVTLYEGKEFPFIIYIRHGNDTVVNGTGDIPITVSAPDTDTTDLAWSAYFIENATDVVYDSVLSFGFDIGITSDSRRFPDNVTIFYRVPFISSFVPDSLSFSGLEFEFEPMTSVNQFGLQFEIKRLRFDYVAEFNFSIVVDPDKYLEYGLLTRHMDVPVDVRYYEEDKNMVGTAAEFYTDVSVLEYEITVPQCMYSLGMEDGGIKDCQLSASVNDGTHSAQDGRLNSDSGWVTIERGPPFYQHEYIQVDMGGQVRISAVTIQPYKDDGVNISRITSFKLQHSREGILWNYVKDDSGVEQVFNLNWTNLNTVDSTATVELLELAFLTRYVRILPQENAEASYVHKLRFELHGCPWPYKSQLPTYVCAAPAPPVKPYDERQMLAIKEHIFVCMIATPNDLPYCSGSNDFGLTWFAIDDMVMNVLGYELSKDTLYALSRNRNNTLRSTDKGHTWAVIEESDFSAMSALPGYRQAKALPFPLQGDTMADLLAAYGYVEHDTHAWSVSNQALHAIPTEDSIGTKTTADDQVARWGTTEWNGPEAI